jgi:hypothetical protein
LNKVDTYLEYNNEKDPAQVLNAANHKKYCPIDNGDLCTPDIKMHLGLKQCLIDSLPAKE